ncbi:MAG TPA: hypothetical protein PKD61_30145, partial [Polyangiaceae bacterium]|nr:hypothetical protein [Polyangiaceae bacterium]
TLRVGMVGGVVAVSACSGLVSFDDLSGQPKAGITDDAGADASADADAIAEKDATAEADVEVDAGEQHLSDRGCHGIAIADDGTIVVTHFALDPPKIPTLSKVTLDQGQWTLVSFDGTAGNQAPWVVVDGDVAYSTANDYLFATNLKTGSTLPLVTLPGKRVWGVAVLKQWVYFTESPGPPATGSLRRFPLGANAGDSGVVEIVVSNLLQPQALSVLGDWVYLAVEGDESAGKNGSLRRVHVDTGKVEVIHGESPEQKIYPWGLVAVDDNGKTRVYFTQDKTGGLYITDPGVVTKWNAVDKNDSTLLTNMRRAGGVAVGGGRAFWSMREATNQNKAGALFTDALGATGKVGPWLDGSSTVGLAWHDGYLYRCAESGLHRIKVP